MNTALPDVKGVSFQSKPDGQTSEIGKPATESLFLKVNKALLEQERQFIIKRFNFDPDQALQKLGEAGVNFAGALKTGSYGSIREAMYTKLSETQAETAFPYLLRYGINKEILSMYELTKPSYREWARITTSEGFENYYPAVFLPGRPQRVERGQEYPDLQLSGFQVIIRNYKFGGIISIESELWEDDQSGVIPMRAQSVGDGMSQTEELFFYQQFAAAVAAGTFTAAGTQGAGGALNIGQLETAWPKIRKIQDGDGNLIGVRPDVLVVDADDEIMADLIYTAVLWPQNNAGSYATTLDANINQFGAPNPMKGRFRPVVSDFLRLSFATASNPNGWGIDNTTAPKILAQSKKGVIFQERTALKVTQETPGSGANFTRGDIRYSAVRRCGAGVGEPRFEYILN